MRYLKRTSRLIDKRAMAQFRVLAEKAGGSEVTHWPTAGGIEQLAKAKALGK